MNDNCNIPPKQKTWREFFRSWRFWKSFIGISLGILGGFLYFHYVGCEGGSCAITSNPYSSMIAGGFIGFFVTGSSCSRCA